MVTLSYIAICKWLRCSHVHNLSTAAVSMVWCFGVLRYAMFLQDCPSGTMNFEVCGG